MHEENMEQKYRPVCCVGCEPNNFCVGSVCHGSL
jgi:hypothetical protein